MGRRDDRVEREVGAYLAEEVGRQRVPGLSAAVLLRGQPLLIGGYGMADIELSVPATPDTVYELASVTKPFTATAVALLSEDGELGLDDPVRTYFPESPPAWSEVTVRHLLAHTSGIPNYFELDTFRPRGEFDWRLDYDQGEFLAAVAAAPLRFRPGERSGYSNSGYYLLGMLVERVAGEPYGRFLARRIFEPLGMGSTCLNDRAAIIPGRADGYTLRDGALGNAEYTSNTWAYAEGGIVSSASDMARWDAALTEGRVLPPPLLRRMWEPARLSDGRAGEFGLSWWAGEIGGRRVIAHNGSKPGFSSDHVRFVGEGLSVVLLANRDGVQLRRLVEAVAGLLPIGGS
ncbi:MAG: beta-lactamase family protein [Actinomycetota bacterium]|nr:beta-lactamase family protein [Actinomycetota bacterium]